VGKPNRANTHGYTLIEVLTVIMVLAVIIGSGWALSAGYVTYLQKARDTERQSDVEGLARYFEQYYRINASVSGPTYPTTTQVNSSLTSLIDPSDTSITRAPDQSSNSVSVAADTNAARPSFDQYIYQPITSAGAICSAAPCVRFVLYYRSETTGNVVTVESRRQQ